MSSITVIYLLIIKVMEQFLHITVAEQTKAWTVFARLNAGIMDSNPTQGMDVCVCLFCVYVVLVCR
jgi:hypothetical protein